MSSEERYNLEDEVREIGTDLSKSRNDVIIGILSFLGGTILAKSLTEISLMDRVRSFVGYGNENEDEDE